MSFSKRIPTLTLTLTPTLIPKATQKRIHGEDNSIGGCKDNADQCLKASKTCKSERLGRRLLTSIGIRKGKKKPKGATCCTNKHGHTDLWKSIATDERFITEISDCCPRGSTWGMSEQNAINADKTPALKALIAKHQSMADMADSQICFRTGRGSAYTTDAKYSTEKWNQYQVKPELTEIDKKKRDKNTPVKCSTNFGLQIFECKDCSCTVKVDGKKKQQLVQFHTHHSLATTSDIVTCTPWFVYVDGMIRNMISKVRKQAIDTAVKRCATATPNSPSPPASSPSPPASSPSPPASTILKPGTLVTLNRVAGQGTKYCTSSAGQKPSVCNAEKPELFCVLNAGDGNIALHSGKNAYTGELTPPHP